MDRNQCSRLDFDETCWLVATARHIWSRSGIGDGYDDDCTKDSMKTDESNTDHKSSPKFHRHQRDKFPNVSIMFTCIFMIFHVFFIGFGDIFGIKTMEYWTENRDIA